MALRNTRIATGRARTRRRPGRYRSAARPLARSRRNRLSSNRTYTTRRRRRLQTRSLR